VELVPPPVWPDLVEGGDVDFVTVKPTPAMCAAAPVFTSGTANTGVTVSAVFASIVTCDAGMVAAQLPSEPGVASTGVVLCVPSVAATETPVASGWATPETVIGPSATVLGPLVIAFRAHGASELQPGIGPEPAAASAGWTATLVEFEAPPKRPAWLKVTVSPGWRSGVSACESAPFCQQSPPGFIGVGVVVLTENGVNWFPAPENSPMTTGAPVSASERVASTVAVPNEGRLVASTLSPVIAIVGELAMAGADTAAEAMSAAAAGAIRRTA
jgi:hypothetical protein